MTNRQVWEARILAMSDAEFSTMLCSGEFQNEYGVKMCEYCRKIHGGECPRPDEETPCVEDEEYLRGEAMA